MLLQRRLITLNLQETFYKEKRFQINTLSFYFENLKTKERKKKEEQNKPKARRRKKMIKIREEIKDTENRKPVKKINETKR